MNDHITKGVEALVRCAAARQPLGTEDPPTDFKRDNGQNGVPHYRNENARLAIDFTVERLAFPHLQTMDPRLVRVAPGKHNEYHRHAHESIFVVLEGEGEVFIGAHWMTVKRGDIAFVPRWIFHQTRNTSATEELVVLAVTDFGFTSAVLGDYDHRTRLSQRGDDVSAGVDAAI